MNKHINEGLRPNDLKHFVDDIIAIDQFKSKMGEDSDVIVMAFTVKDKNPAVDLMEFIERGYPFVLDADISAGEESDGSFRVFVEIERTPKFPKQCMSILDGISRLSDNWDWRFRYYKHFGSIDASVDALQEMVPLTPSKYTEHALAVKNGELKSFFNRGATESVVLNSENMLTVRRPYAESLEMRLLAHGPYETIKESVTGGLQLDAASVGQTSYLEKFLGNYEISKINGLFLIRNGDDAVLLQHRTWGR